VTRSDREVLEDPLIEFRFVKGCDMPLIGLDGEVELRHFFGNACSRRLLVQSPQQSKEIIKDRCVRAGLFGLLAQRNKRTEHAVIGVVRVAAAGIWQEEHPAAR
jgi:hypothetical protein